MGATVSCLTRRCSGGTVERAQNWNSKASASIGDVGACFQLTDSSQRIRNAAAYSLLT